MVDRVRALDERAEARQLDGGRGVQRDRDLELGGGDVMTVRVVQRLDRVADRVGVEEVDERPAQSASAVAVSITVANSPCRLAALTRAISSAGTISPLGSGRSNVCVASSTKRTS